MKRAVICLLTVSTFAVSGCKTGTALTNLGSNPLVSSLTGGIPGLSANQAIGAVGGLLSLAKEHIPAAQWAKVAGAIPGVDSLIAEGLKLAGLKAGGLGNLAGLAGGMNKLGITPDTVSKIVPAVADYIGKSGGAEAANLFKNAIR